jgi:hypothetical protein
MLLLRNSVAICSSSRRSYTACGPLVQALASETALPRGKASLQLHLRAPEYRVRQGPGVGIVNSAIPWHCPDGSETLALFSFRSKLHDPSKDLKRWVRMSASMASPASPAPPCVLPFCGIPEAVASKSDTSAIRMQHAVIVRSES